jgi:hypothetical protein
MLRSIRGVPATLVALQQAMIPSPVILGLGQKASPGNLPASERASAKVTELMLFSPSPCPGKTPSGGSGLGWLSARVEF